MRVHNLCVLVILAACGGGSGNGGNGNGSPDGGTGGNGDGGGGDGDGGINGACTHAGWPAVAWPTTGNLPSAVAVGDFNRDGIADLVTANEASSTVSVMLGTGGGTYAPTVDYPAGYGANDVA